MRGTVAVLVFVLVLLALLSNVECVSRKTPRTTKAPPTPKPTAPYGIDLPHKRGILELTVNSTSIWICSFFFLVWALVQILQFVLTRGYTGERGVVPNVKLGWFSLLKLSYNSQSDDLRRKINAYFLKGIIYPTGLAFSSYSLGVLYSGNNIRKFVFIH
jgi:hypothetical protein